jgi:hypothetical protein
MRTAQMEQFSQTKLSRKVPFLKNRNLLSALRDEHTKQNTKIKLKKTRSRVGRKLETHDHVTVTYTVTRSQTSRPAKWPEYAAAIDKEGRTVAVSVVLLTAILFFCDSCIILSTRLSHAVDRINFPQHAPLG